MENSPRYTFSVNHPSNQIDSRDPNHPYVQLTLDEYRNLKAALRGTGVQIEVCDPEMPRFEGDGLHPPCFDERAEYLVEYTDGRSFIAEFTVENAEELRSRNDVRAVTEVE